MKLAEVLGRIDTPAPAPAKTEAPKTESTPESKPDAGYIDLGIKKKCTSAFYCPVCGKHVPKGTTVAVIQAEGKSVRTYCHVECVGRWNGVADRGAIDPAEIEAIAARLDNAKAAETCSYVETKTNELAELIAELEKTIDAARPQVITVKTPNRETKLEGEHFHPAFEEVLDLVADGEEVFLPGPTGCGKSHLVEQAARALGRRFGAISCSGGTTESHLFGRMVPYGEHGQFEFLGTDFLDCYENGGVFLLDEMDAADENVLIAINSALANGFVSIPARHNKPTAKRHPDFVCVGAANTFGKGADRQYCGRNQLDEATLDRFRAGTIEMDYDRDLETRLCPDTDLRERLWTYRDRAREAKLERNVSTRFLVKAYRMLQRHKANSKTYGYKSIDDYIDSKLSSGWSEREIRTVRGSLPEKE